MADEDQARSFQAGTMRFLMEWAIIVVGLTVVSIAIDLLAPEFAAKIKFLIHSPEEFFATSVAAFIGWGAYRVLKRIRLSEWDRRG
jgi:hypothetical protein